MFAVLRTDNYSANVFVHIFKTYADAKEYLLLSWQDFYNEELADSAISLVSEECWHEEDQAQVVYENGDRESWVLTETESSPLMLYDISTDNGSSWTSQWLTEKDVLDYIGTGCLIRKAKHHARV